MVFNKIGISLCFVCLICPTLNVQRLEIDDAAEGIINLNARHAFVAHFSIVQHKHGGDHCLLNRGLPIRPLWF